MNVNCNRIVIQGNKLRIEEDINQEIGSVCTGWEIDRTTCAINELLQVQKTLENWARNNYHPDLAQQLKREELRIEEVLDISPRVRNLLFRADILTIGDLEGMTEDDFQFVSGFGPKALSELRQALEEYNKSGRKAYNPDKRIIRFNSERISDEDSISGQDE